MEEPRWLDEEEGQTWRSFLLGSRLLLDRIERELKQDADLSFAYYDILSRLSEAPERAIRMCDLASGCAFDRSRLSHAVARLARDGLVRNIPVESDGRARMAQLTDEGMELVRRAAPEHVGQVRALVFDRLTPEQQRSLREISDSLLAGVADPRKLEVLGPT
ncbi:MarR family transcriptional regulator [Kribbella sandramycini]|uniref:MarR family transcriptional regulator n=1 Tax=Kribbella sandramycini TaxID=60450 RepID=A0A7Y4KW64_9ACTN|nr:MarR family transcriptional regulator [Kribbella sandramycini]MBB6567717.1 DNA-binding MarR family transcriptional regulator [Kribbella sandramycini]NOL39685.1 MarR family transcriptional regulator [Kribbella sandramycini]